MGILRYTINACNVLHDTGVIMFTTDELVCGLLYIVLRNATTDELVCGFIK